MQQPFLVAALYRFVRLDNFEQLREPLLTLMLELEVRGTLLLAHEGINGTIAGRPEALNQVLKFLRLQPCLGDLECKLSEAEELPFYRSRVKLKKEIVTMGVEDLDPDKAGTYVKPEDWNQLIQDPEVVVIDTRNTYESAIGSFDNALHANTESFREFPEYAKQHLDPHKHRKVAMFCTGGIRCEKSTAYLKQQGFDEVYHLQGGILKYLEEVDQQDSLWHGECFVFDNRVSVNHSLEKGSYDQCHACRLPITEEDKQSTLYQAGVSCPACHDQKSQQQRARFKERQKQVQLAEKRGEKHIGADAGQQGEIRKSRKLDLKQAQRNQSP
ncbi:MAG: rhodanese-related sulfurtransferase [Pseudomonadota bacterium]